MIKDPRTSTYRRLAGRALRAEAIDPREVDQFLETSRSPASAALTSWMRLFSLPGSPYTSRNFSATDEAEMLSLAMEAPEGSWQRSHTWLMARVLAAVRIEAPPVLDPPSVYADVARHLEQFPFDDVLLNAAKESLFPARSVGPAHETTITLVNTAIDSNAAAGNPPMDSHRSQLAQALGLSADRRDLQRALGIAEGLFATAWGRRDYRCAHRAVVAAMQLGLYERAVGNANRWINTNPPWLPNFVEHLDVHKIDAIVRSGTTVDNGDPLLLRVRNANGTDKAFLMAGLTFTGAKLSSRTCEDIVTSLDEHLQASMPNPTPAQLTRAETIRTLTLMAWHMQDPNSPARDMLRSRPLPSEHSEDMMRLLRQGTLSIMEGDAEAAADQFNGVWATSTRTTLNIGHGWRRRLTELTNVAATRAGDESLVARTRYELETRGDLLPSPDDPDDKTSKPTPPVTHSTSTQSEGGQRSRETLPGREADSHSPSRLPPSGTQGPQQAQTRRWHGNGPPSGLPPMHVSPEPMTRQPRPGPRAGGPELSV